MFSTVRKCAITVHNKWKICEKLKLIESDNASYEKTINSLRMHITDAETDVLSFRNSVAESDPGYSTSLGEVRERDTRRSQVTGRGWGHSHRLKMYERDDFVLRYYWTLWYNMVLVTNRWNHYFDNGNNVMANVANVVNSGLVRLIKTFTTYRNRIFKNFPKKKMSTDYLINSYFIIETSL